jgi:opacity protein-like surface antigen
MKHILPIITLTTLAAAASAQSAAPAGLTYNRVTVNQNTSGGTDRNISVANLIGGSNVLVELTQGSASSSSDVSIGYVFKNVTNGIDATVGITSGTADGIGVNLRRSLSELNAGLELAVSYSRVENSGSEVSYEVSYNINKQFSVAFGAEDVNNANVKSVSVRFNY